jgi:hypothetical protein
VEDRKVVRRRGKDDRLTDGGEVFSLTRRPAALYTQEDFWFSFLLEAELTPGR